MPPSSSLTIDRKRTSSLSLVIKPLNEWIPHKQMVLSIIMRNYTQVSLKNIYN